MQTLIAAFDDRRTAQRAIDQLVHSGFDAGAVHLQAGYESAEEQSSTNPEKMNADDYQSGFSDRIGLFFGGLFGREDDSEDSATATQRAAASDGDTAPSNRNGRLGSYAEAARRGSSVVVVDTTLESDFDHVENLMYELGAIDVDARAADWKRQGWTGFDSSAPVYRADESMQPSNLNSAVDEGEQLQAGNRGPGRRGVQMVRDRVPQKL